MSAQAHLTWQESPTSAILHVGGRLDAHTVSEIWAEALEGLRLHAGQPVRITTRSVEYCDGAGVALLMDLIRQPRDPGADVSLVDTPEAVQRMLAPFRTEDFRVEAIPRAPRPAFRQRLGDGLHDLGLHLYRQVTFVGEAAFALLYAARHPGRVRWRDALDIAQEAGANALPIVMLIAFLMGVILAFQSAVAMRQFGAEIFGSSQICGELETPFHAS